MAKQKTAPTVVNRHIYSRASYLYQAANYLAEVSHQTQDDSKPTATNASRQTKTTQNLSRQLASDLKLVCQKNVIRQTPGMKRTICKFCNTTLIEGETSHSTVENPSQGGKKPWADLLVIGCLTCGNAKRYPVSARRQKRQHLRQAEATNTVEEKANQRQETSRNKDSTSAA